MTEATWAPGDQPAPAPASDARHAPGLAAEPDPARPETPPDPSAARPRRGASAWVWGRPRWLLWLVAAVIALLLAGWGFAAGYATGATITSVVNTQNERFGPFGDRDGRGPGPGWNDDDSPSVPNA